MIQRIEKGDFVQVRKTSERGRVVAYEHAEDGTPLFVVKLSSGWMIRATRREITLIV